jgi:hypothetical protein
MTCRHSSPARIYQGLGRNSEKERKKREEKVREGAGVNCFHTVFTGTKRLLGGSLK